MIYEIETYTVVDILKLKESAILAEETDESSIGAGRTTTALASVLFATIETLGILFRDDITDDTAYSEFLQNKENAKRFFVTMEPFGLEPINHSDVDIIYMAIRNGFTHSLFPKLGMGIAFNKNWIGIKKLLIETDDGLHLNVAYLTDYVLKAIESVVYKYNSHNGFKAMYDKNFSLYTTIQNLDLKNKNQFRKLLEQHYPRIYTKHYG